MPKRSTSWFRQLSHRFGRLAAGLAILVALSSIAAVILGPPWLRIINLPDLVEFKPSLVLHGQVWRLISYPWIETSPLNLVLSIWAMLIFLPALEGIWGEKQLLFRVAMLILVPAIFLTVLGHWLIGLRDLPVMGLWGLLSATVVAYAAELPEQQIYLFMILRVGGDTLLMIEGGLLALVVLFNGTIFPFLLPLLSFGFCAGLVPLQPREGSATRAPSNTTQTAGSPAWRSSGVAATCGSWSRTTRNRRLDSCTNAVRPHTIEPFAVPLAGRLDMVVPQSMDAEHGAGVWPVRANAGSRRRTTMTHATRLAGCLSSIVLLAATIANASPIDLYGGTPQGIAFASGMTAWADDGMATYFNPAGLAVGGSKGKVKIQIGYMNGEPDLYITRWKRDAATLSNFPTAKPAGDGFIVGSILVPLGGIIKNIVSIGVFFCLPQDGLLHVQALEPTNPQWMRYGTEFDRITVGAGLAARPLRWLAFGLGVQEFASFGGADAFTVNSNKAQLTNRNITFALQGVAAPIAGITFLPDDRLTLAVSYRGAINLDIDLPDFVKIAPLVNSSDPTHPISVGSLNIGATGHVLYSPHTICRFGAKYSPTSNLSVGLDHQV